MCVYACVLLQVRQIAGFVGAESLTNDDLCCMVVQPEEFMGSHSKDVQGAQLISCTYAHVHTIFVWSHPS